MIYLRSLHIVLPSICVYVCKSNYIYVQIEARNLKQKKRLKKNVVAILAKGIVFTLCWNFKMNYSHPSDMNLASFRCQDFWSYDYVAWETGAAQMEHEILLQSVALILLVCTALGF